jgi:hypothetical protein
MLHSCAGRQLAADGGMRGFALLAGVLIAGCGEHGSAGTDADKCGQLGCASGPGILTLTVLDAKTQQPVKGMLMFSANGQQVPFACTVSVDLTKVACPSWDTQALFGAFDVQVTVTGYQPNTVHVRVDGPAGCCGFGPPTSASLALEPL